MQTLHHYLVKLNRDGAFRVNGLPVGDYELAFPIGDRSKASTDSVGSNVVRFQVDESDVKRRNLDLLDVEIEAAVSN